MTPYERMAERERKTKQLCELCGQVGVDFEDAQGSPDGNGCIYFLSDAARKKFMAAAIVANIPLKIELNNRLNFVLNVSGLK